MRQHLHHYFQLDILLEGRTTVFIEGHPPFDGRPGDGWLIPPLLRHAFTSKSCHRHASFKFHLAPPFWALVRHSFQRFRASPALRAILNLVGARFLKGGSLIHQQVDAAITLALAEIPQRTPESPRQPVELSPFRAQLFPLLEKIIMCPQERWTVGAMARACHLSTAHFSRSFRLVLGMSPRRFLLDQLMRAAATALTASQPVPIKRIAELSGYCSVHPFTRAFRKVFHTSPAVYRSTHLTMDDGMPRPLTWGRKSR